MIPVFQRRVALAAGARRVARHGCVYKSSPGDLAYGSPHAYHSRSQARKALVLSVRVSLGRIQPVSVESMVRNAELERTSNGPFNMPIRTDDPIPRSQSLVLLVEDCGLREFLLKVLEVTSIAEHDLHVVGGRGWTAAYQKYDELVDVGVDAARIIPILDADTLGEKGPRSTIHGNSRIFRFQFDLEFTFATAECMLLDHALLLLRPTDVFGTYGSVTALGKWTRIIEQAYRETVQPRKKAARI